MQNLTFRILDHSSEAYVDAVKLVEEIVDQPPNFKFFEQKLEAEKNNIHFAGFFDGKICATATMTCEDDKFFLQKFAVKKDLQSKGIGSQLLKFCEEYAAENEVRVIYANARDSVGRSAVNFFVKNEYFCGDEDFYEDGIPHKIVWKILF